MSKLLTLVIACINGNLMLLLVCVVAVTYVAAMCLNLFNLILILLLIT